MNLKPRETQTVRVMLAWYVPTSALRTGDDIKRDLSDHVNPQRPGYALGDEAGLLLCSWPRGGKPSLPFVYSDEVWTGIEYQVASHLIRMGQVEAGLAIVRAVRDRYDGRWRNPFDEYGHFYARAMGRSHCCRR